MERKGKKRGRERLTVSETVFLHCVLYLYIYFFNYLRKEKKKSSLHFGNLGYGFYPMPVTLDSLQSGHVSKIDTCPDRSRSSAL